MNLKEFIFYSGITQKELAKYLDVTPTYVRHVISGVVPVSKKFARNVQRITHGMVKDTNVVGPPSHPDAKKILEMSSNNP